MSQIFIVSWPDSTSAGATNGNSLSNITWHFLPKESAEVTRCERSLPLPSSRTYADIQTDHIKHVKGFCSICFHDLCISEQDKDLWQLYEKVEALDTAIRDIKKAITQAKCSAEEIGSALALLEELRLHPVFESLTGK